MAALVSNAVSRSMGSPSHHPSHVIPEGEAWLRPAAVPRRRSSV